MLQLCSSRFAVALLSLCFTAFAEPARSADRPPNILFLFADDMRRDALGAAGNADVRTPTLDALFARSQVFHRAYCMGSMHGAVCQPSRAMLMTGRTLYRAPLQLNDVPLMPSTFADAEYATFGTGKWHNGQPSFAAAFEQGTNVFFGGMSDHTKVPIRDLVDSDRYTEPARRGEKFSSELFADAAVGFLEAYAEGGKERPFFTYVAFTAPHDPRQPPREVLDRYDPSQIKLPPNFLPQHPFNNGALIIRDEVLAAWPRTPEVIRDQLAEYYGMITHLDEQIARILATVEAIGEADNTIIVFAADHGLAMGSHGLLGKQSLYEHSMGAPLAISGPGVPVGDNDALVYLYDLFPTLCGLAGVEVPEGVEGRDLSVVWNNDAGSVRDHIYLSYAKGQRAVVEPRWKLIRYPLIDREQLFDLQNDPTEMDDLIGDEKYADHRKRLLAKLAASHAAVDDPDPLTVDDPRSGEIDLTGHERQPDEHQPDWIVKKYFDP